MEYTRGHSRQARPDRGRRALRAVLDRFAVQDKGSAAAGFQIFFDFEGGHAAAAGSSDGLAVFAVLDVAGAEDAGKDGAVEGAVDVVVGEDVAVLVEVHHALEAWALGMWPMPRNMNETGRVNCSPETVFLRRRPLTSFSSTPRTSSTMVELRNSIGGVGFGALEHDGRGAEALGAVDEGDFAREAGEEEGFLHGRVAAADHRDGLARGEEAIAGGAGADAMANEGLFGGEVEPAGAGSGGDDEGAGVDDLVADGELDGVRGEVGVGEVGHAQLGTEALGLLLHVLDEFGALDAFGPAGEVLDQGGDGELAAGFVAFKDERLEVGTGGVDGGGQAGASGAQDDDVAGFGGGFGSHEPT